MLVEEVKNYLHLPEEQVKQICNENGIQFTKEENEYCFEKDGEIVKIQQLNG